MNGAERATGAEAVESTEDSTVGRVGDADVLESNRSARYRRKSTALVRALLARCAQEHMSLVLHTPVRALGALSSWLGLMACAVSRRVRIRRDRLAIRTVVPGLGLRRGLWWTNGASTIVEP